MKELRKDNQYNNQGGSYSDAQEVQESQESQEKI